MSSFDNIVELPSFLSVFNFIFDFFTIFYVIWWCFWEKNVSKGMFNRFFWLCELKLKGTSLQNLVNLIFVNISITVFYWRRIRVASYWSKRWLIKFSVYFTFIRSLDWLSNVAWLVEIRWVWEIGCSSILKQTDGILSFFEK